MPENQGTSPQIDSRLPHTASLEHQLPVGSAGDFQPSVVEGGAATSPSISAQASSMAGASALPEEAGASASDDDSNMAAASLDEKQERYYAFVCA